MLSTSICWNCERCYGRCSWSREFKPVKGWKATATTVINVIGTGKYRKGKPTPSYHVQECPLFEKSPCDGRT